MAWHVMICHDMIYVMMCDKVCVVLHMSCRGLMCCDVMCWTNTTQYNTIQVRIVFHLLCHEWSNLLPCRCGSARRQPGSRPLRPCRPWGRQRWRVRSLAACAPRGPPAAHREWNDTTDTTVMTVMTDTTGEERSEEERGGASGWYVRVCVWGGVLVMRWYNGHTHRRWIIMEI